MTVLYLILGIISIYLLILKNGGKAQEHGEVNKDGGFKIMYNDYFNYLKKAFPSLTRHYKQGSLINYRCMTPETRVQFEIKSQYVKKNIFTSYKAYISNSGLKSTFILHRSICWKMHE